jgi:hypothetical protein
VIDRDAEARCPSCGRPLGTGSLLPGIPIGSVLALIGGLALVTAYFMPWFSAQGLLLSGSFLARFLGTPADVQRFMPALAGNPRELQLLRALIYLFPISGAVATCLAIIHGLWPGRPIWVTVLLTASGAIPLAALLIGLSRLPPGATAEVGLWQLGIGCVLIVGGVALSRFLSR